MDHKPILVVQDEVVSIMMLPPSAEGGSRCVGWRYRGSYGSLVMTQASVGFPDLYWYIRPFSKWIED